MSPSNALPNPVDDLVTEQYLAASSAAVEYVQAQAARILQTLELWELPSEPQPLSALAAGLGVPADLSFALAWLLHEASFLAVVEVTERPGEEVSYAPIEPPSPQALDAARERLEEHAAFVGSSREMLDYVAGRYPEYLLGQRSGASILLKGPALKLWEDYFAAANPLYDIHNQLGWLGLREALAHLGRPAHVLELGAGTGGGSAAILAGLRRLDAGSGAIASLTLSDISPSLLLGTLERLSSPPVGDLALRRQRLDFSRPLIEQGVPPGSLDVLVGINALHNCSELDSALAALSPALAPDGWLVLSESICQQGAQVHQDFVFNLLPQVRKSPAPQPRTSSRFYSAEVWAEALATAGLPSPSRILVNGRGPQLALLALVPASPAQRSTF